MVKKVFACLLAFAFCFVLSACSSSGNVKTLECTAKTSEGEATIILKQDQSTYKFTEMSLTTSIDKSLYGDIEISDSDLEKAICENSEQEYKSCSAKVKGNNIVANMVIDANKYEKEIIDDEDMGIEKLDENTLNKLKESTETNKEYSCKIY